jgi:hypothetical protein
MGLFLLYQNYNEINTNYFRIKVTNDNSKTFVELKRLLLIQNLYRYQEFKNSIKKVLLKNNIRCIGGKNSMSFQGNIKIAKKIIIKFHKIFNDKKHADDEPDLSDDDYESNSDSEEYEDYDEEYINESDEDESDEDESDEDESDEDEYYSAVEEQ